MSSGFGLVLPHIVHDVHNDHEEPYEHGYQHGDVRGLPVQAAEVHPGIQKFDQRLTRVLPLGPRVFPPAALTHPPHGAFTDDPVDRLGLQVEGLHQLLQGAVAVPGVVVKPRLGPGGAELLAVGLPQQVVRKVQQAQLGPQVPQGPRSKRVDAVVRQVQVPQVDQVTKGALWEVSDVVVFQVEGDSLRRDTLGDLPQPRVRTLHRGRVPGALAASGALGRRLAPQDQEQQREGHPGLKIHPFSTPPSSCAVATSLLTPACAHRLTIAP